jgi:hypothetical protein
MIGQILPNNNERCYSNFLPTFREVNTPSLPCTPRRAVFAPRRGTAPAAPGGIIGCSCRCCIRFERDASSFLVSCDLMFCVLVFVYDACFYSTLKMVACCNCNPNNKCSSAISEIKTTNRIGGPKSLELCSVVAFFFFLERTAKSLIGIEKTEFQF